MYIANDISHIHIFQVTLLHSCNHLRTKSKDSRTLFFYQTLSGYSGVSYWLGAQDYIQEGTFEWLDGDEVLMDKWYWAAVSSVP